MYRLPRGWRLDIQDTTCSKAESSPFFTVADNRKDRVVGFWRSAYAHRLFDCSFHLDQGEIQIRARVIFTNYYSAGFELKLIIKPSKDIIVFPQDMPGRDEVAVVPYSDGQSLTKKFACAFRGFDLARLGVVDRWFCRLVVGEHEISLPDRRLLIAVESAFPGRVGRISGPVAWLQECFASAESERKQDYGKESDMPKHHFAHRDAWWLKGQKQETG